MALTETRITQALADASNTGMPEGTHLFTKDDARRFIDSTSPETVFKVAIRNPVPYMGRPGVVGTGSAEIHVSRNQAMAISKHFCTDSQELVGARVPIHVSLDKKLRRVVRVG